MALMDELQLETAFEVQFDVTLRLAERADLSKLEWFGQFTHYRNVFRHTFADQERGQRLMILADVNGFPVGQIFIHLSDARVREDRRERRGYIYALRVMEPLRGQGIGTRLILRAEELLIEDGYRWVAIAVAKDNPKARRLYERLGYILCSDDPGIWQYEDHQGEMQRVVEPSWVLQKRL